MALPPLPLPAGGSVAPVLPVPFGLSGALTAAGSASARGATRRAAAPGSVRTDREVREGERAAARGGPAAGTVPSSARGAGDPVVAERRSPGPRAGGEEVVGPLGKAAPRLRRRSGWVAESFPWAGPVRLFPAPPRGSEGGRGRSRPGSPAGEGPAGPRWFPGAAAGLLRRQAGPSWRARAALGRGGWRGTGQADDARCPAGRSVCAEMLLSQNQLININ